MTFFVAQMACYLKLTDWGVTTINWFKLSKRYTKSNGEEKHLWCSFRVDSLRSVESLLYA